MSGSDPPPARAGRPRNKAIEAVVLDATIDLLSDHGFHGVSVDDIAAATHTGKDTLYRRWPSKRLLVDAALDRLVHRSIHALPDGSPQESLVAYLMELDRLVTTTPIGHILASSVGEAVHDVEIAAWLGAFWRARRVEASSLLRDDADTRPQASAVSIELDVVFGALLYRWFVDHASVTPAYVGQLADHATNVRYPVEHPPPTARRDDKPSDVD